MLAAAVNIDEDKILQLNNDEVLPFQHQTEEQLIRRIDHSIAQIDDGLYSDTEDFEKEMLAGIPK